MDVHAESISICVRNAVGKIVMECVIETKAVFDGLGGDLWVTFEEGTRAAWLHDLLKPHGLRSAMPDQPEACPGEHHVQTFIGFGEPLLPVVDSYGVDGLAVPVCSRGRQRHDFAVVGERCRCSEK